MCHEKLATGVGVQRVDWVSMVSMGKSDTDHRWGRESWGEAQEGAMIREVRMSRLWNWNLAHPLNMRRSHTLSPPSSPPLTSR